MLSPKKLRYQKMHKRYSYRKEYKVNSLVFSDFGLKSMRSCRVSAKQLESSRKTMLKRMKKLGKLVLRIFPDVPITKKPAEVRMGKGKGALDYWCFTVNSGRVLFEFQGVSKSIAEEAALLGSKKLPMQTKFVTLEKR